jgi:hypothetical protein
MDWTAHSAFRTSVIDPFLPAEHWQDAEIVQGTAAELHATAKNDAEYGIRVVTTTTPGSWSPPSKA